jgi:hypothetical protein
MSSLTHDFRTTQENTNKMRHNSMSQSLAPREWKKYILCHDFNKMKLMPVGGLSGD